MPRIIITEKPEDIEVDVIFSDIDSLVISKAMEDIQHYSPNELHDLFIDLFHPLGMVKVVEHFREDYYTIEDHHCKTLCQSFEPHYVLTDDNLKVCCKCGRGSTLRDAEETDRPMQRSKFELAKFPIPNVGYVVVERRDDDEGSWHMVLVAHGRRFEQPDGYTSEGAAINAAEKFSASLASN